MVFVFDTSSPTIRVHVIWQAVQIESAVDDNAAFYAKKKAQKAAKAKAEALWGDIVKAAKESGNVDADSLQTMWDEYDTDRSGAVDAGELTKLITALVAKVAASCGDVAALVDATIAVMDRDGDGLRVSFVCARVIRVCGVCVDVCKC